MYNICFEGVLELKRAGGGLDVSNSIFSSRQAVWNIKSTPAVFRANNPSKVILHMVVAAGLLFIVTSSYKYHLVVLMLSYFLCLSSSMKLCPGEVTKKDWISRIRKSKPARNPFTWLHSKKKQKLDQVSRESSNKLGNPHESPVVFPPTWLGQIKIKHV